MIVVRTNLCRFRQEHRRRLRPKLLIGAAAAVVLCAALISDLGEWRALHALRDQVEASQKLQESLIRELDKARQDDANLAIALARRDAALQFGASRRNWAPVLGEAFAAVT